MHDPAQQSLVCAQDPDSGTQQLPLRQIPRPQQSRFELHGSFGAQGGGGGWHLPLTHDSLQQSSDPVHAAPSAAQLARQRAPKQIPEQHAASL